MMTELYQRFVFSFFRFLLSYGHLNTVSQGFDGDEFGEEYDEENLDVLTEVLDHQLDLVDGSLDAHTRQDDGKERRGKSSVTYSIQTYI
jgi:hypothetical protein